MFEFQVFSSGSNVAKGKTATQSSTLNTKYASNASDGDTSTFSHTMTLPFLGGKLILTIRMMSNMSPSIIVTVVIQLIQKAAFVASPMLF